jgi:hypothetical protein
VVHGWWISKLLVLSCGVLAVLVAWLFAGRKERRRGPTAARPSVA